MTIPLSSGASTIAVTARDPSGNPISGVTVQLAATGSGNTLTQPSEPTNASGLATGSLSASSPGPRTVSAQIGGVTIRQTATVTVHAGSVSAERSTIAASATSVRANSGSRVAITVMARDASGNPLRGVSVVLAAKGATSTLTQPVAPTDANGMATGAVSVSAVGQAVVSASIDGLPIREVAAITATEGHSFPWAVVGVGAAALGAAAIVISGQKSTSTSSPGGGPGGSIIVVIPNP